MTATQDAVRAERVLFPVATDGVPLAVYEYGDRSHPTVVLVHGFPDSHTVWPGVIKALEGQFHVVAYDVRGTGQSGAPPKRSGYRVEQLSNDLDTVIRLTSPDQPVHLLAHDWGAIQSWESATDPRFAGRLISFTSISGPSFDMAGVWLRNGHRYLRNFARQAADSWYVFAFQLPRLPELLVRRGVVDAIATHSERIGVPVDRQLPADRRQQRDALNGIQLYRANMGRLLAPRPRHAICPVLVITPRDDAHVTVALAREAPVDFVPDLRTREIEGNHWVVEQEPSLVVDQFREFITALEAKETRK